MATGAELYPTARVRRTGVQPGFADERVVRVSRDGRTALVVSESCGVRVSQWVSCSRLELVKGGEDGRGEGGDVGSF